MDNIVFRPFTREDLPLAKEIYDHYILHSTATFHTTPISLAELETLIPIGHPRYKSFLVLIQEVPCGYCFLSQYKKREAYDRSAEVTLYLAPDFLKKGIGKRCMEVLERHAIETGIKVLLGIISADNLGSVQLFQKMGYEKCAHYKQVGEKFNKILDVVAYQKILTP